LDECRRRDLVQQRSEVIGFLIEFHVEKARANEVTDSDGDAKSQLGVITGSYVTCGSPL